MKRLICMIATVFFAIAHTPALFAATISGTVVYDDFQFGDIIAVLAFDMELNDAGSDILLFGPDAFEITGLGDGEYRLVASLQEDFDPSIAPGEIFSPYPDNPIIIENDQSVSNVVIELRPEAIQGTVTYEGDQTGTVTVMAFESGFEGGIFPANVNQLDQPGAYNMVGFLPGSYYVGAFLDANGNLLPEPLEEPFAIYADPDSLLPEEIVVEEGGVVSGIDLILEDLPLNSINGFITWEGTPAGPIVIAAMLEPGNLGTVEHLSLSFEPGEYRIYVDPGTFYIFAFVDINGNMLPDEGIDALGFYGNGQPEAVTVADQEEVTGIDFALTMGPTAIENPSPNSAVPDVLAQNYPNPFFAPTQTAISFQLEKTTAVDLAIFDVAGRRVATLANETTFAGSHTVYWDGRNASGETVTAGIYFYRLKTADQTYTRSLVLMR